MHYRCCKLFGVFFSLFSSNTTIRPSTGVYLVSELNIMFNDCLLCRFTGHLKGRLVNEKFSFDKLHNPTCYNSLPIHSMMLSYKVDLVSRAFLQNHLLGMIFGSLDAMVISSVVPIDCLSASH